MSARSRRGSLSVVALCARRLEGDMSAWRAAGLPTDR